MAKKLLVPSMTVNADVMEVASDLAVPVIACVTALMAAFALAYLLRRAMRLSASRWPLLNSLSFGAKWPLRGLFATIGLWLAIDVTNDESSSTGILEQLLIILAITSAAWLLIAVTRASQDGILSRFPTDMADNGRARRVHTQVQILGRLTIALIILIAVAASLLSFPGMRTVGASILASAGLAAIVAGLAAQSALANIFAGLQVAFADAIRVDDVVIVEGQYGRIEEITLTYVVVLIWDERRMVLPSTYFTSTPFENWTRTATELVGTVEIDVDWTVSVAGMRLELDRLLAETDLWDGRSSGIQITEATGGVLRVRALASSSSASNLWDLRCHLREALVAWVQHSGAGLPRTRVEWLPGASASPDPGILPGRPVE